MCSNLTLPTNTIKIVLKKVEVWNKIPEELDLQTITKIKAGE